MKRGWRERQRLVYLGLIILPLIGFAAASTTMNILINRAVQPSAQQPEPLVTAAETTVKSIRLVAMGDMLAHDSVVDGATTADGYDFTQYFELIRPAIDTADIVFCNPESPVAGTTLGVSGYPSFNAPEEFARDLSSVGCNMINLATNHINDKGQAGIDASRTIWESLDATWLHGANRDQQQQEAVSVATVNGVRVGFVAFADFSNSPPTYGYSLNRYDDTALVERTMAAVLSQSDIVVVSAHWGDEGSVVPNEEQKSIARRFTELGADIIIGTGPHVLQPVETVVAGDNQALVWYSIGNALSSQLEVNELTGIVAQMTIDYDTTNKSLTVSNIDAVPTFMSYKWSPADRRSENLAARSNLRLDYVANSSNEIQTMFPGETSKSRLDYVEATLGDEVKIRQQP